MSLQVPIRDPQSAPPRRRKLPKRAWSMMKTGVAISVVAFIIPHFIPGTGKKPIIDDALKGIISFLGIPIDKSPGSLHNLVGAGIYLFAWVLFAGIGAGIGYYFYQRNPATEEEIAKEAAKELEAENALNKASVEAASVPVSQARAEEKGPADTPLKEALGIGAGAGAVAGVLGHFAGGKIGFGIFLIVYLLSLSQLKGTGKFFGLAAFVVAGVITLGIFKALAN